MPETVIQTRRSHWCYGCCKLFPPGSILLRRASRINTVNSGNNLVRHYLCEACYSHTIHWTDADWLKVIAGDVGGWSQGQWYACDEPDASSLATKKLAFPDRSESQTAIPTSIVKYVKPEDWYEP